MVIQIIKTGSSLADKGRVMPSSFSRMKLCVLGHCNPRGVQERAAGCADPHLASAWIPVLRLKYRLLSILEAGSTKIMRLLFGAHFWLQNVGGRPLPYILKFVALRLAFPVFELSQPFFKASYALNQRKLLMLRGEKCGLEFDDFGGLQCGFAGCRFIQFTQRFGDVQQRLEGGNSGKNFRRHEGEPLITKYKNTHRASLPPAHLMHKELV